MRKDPHSYADDAQPTVTHLSWHVDVDFATRTLGCVAELALRGDGGAIDLDTREVIIESVDDGAIRLRLRRAELDQLPDFAWHDFLTPPPTWTSFVPGLDGPALVPASQRKRIGPGEQDITPGTRVLAQDGPIGVVDRVEVDRFGQLQAFWVQSNGIFAADMRIPAEWVQRTGDDASSLRVAASRADIEAYIGYESRVRLRR